MASLVVWFDLTFHLKCNAGHNWDSSEISNFHFALIAFFFFAFLAFFKICALSYYLCPPFFFLLSSSSNIHLFSYVLFYLSALSS